MNAENEELIRKYLHAISASVSGDELGAFLHPEIRQYEYPSRLNPNGRARGRAEMLADFDKGKALLSKQEYRIKNCLSDGDRVCVEAEWSGTLAIGVGTLKAGDQMRANFGVFFRIEDRKIIAQNNYDCIHPF